MKLGYGHTTAKESCFFCKKKTGDYKRAFENGISIQIFLCDICQSFTLKMDALPPIFQLMKKILY